MRPGSWRLNGKDCSRNSRTRRNVSASATRWKSGSRTPSRRCVGSLEVSTGIIQGQRRGIVEGRQEAVEKLVKPLSEKIETLDKARAKNAGEFQTQISNLMRTNKELSEGAQALSNALKRPDVRGRWERPSSSAYSNCPDCVRISISRCRTASITTGTSANRHYSPSTPGTDRDSGFQGLACRIDGRIRGKG